MTSAILPRAACIPRAGISTHCDSLKGLGEGAPSIGVVQKAVGRLTRGEILVRVERGEYRAQDDVFLEWLKRST
ncbi:MAG TPA: hypothetical protein VN325_23630 [Steroidobacteraceae bacterium]|nr:hypothetical protein [Steroidobacteraceae bacterium]